jgi:hypothetical protein
MIRTITLTAAATLALSGLNAQTTGDSLAGFDESAAIRLSIQQNFRGPELRVHLAQMKRNYILDKYNIKVPPAQYDFSAAFKAATPACVNEDFEASAGGAVTASAQVNGWILTAGSHTIGMGSNACTPIGCCPVAPSEASLIAAPNGYIDPVIGSVYPIYSVFGPATGHTMGPSYNPQLTSGMFGNKFIRINSQMNNYSIERLSKTFTVTNQSAMFKFAFISVQSGGHTCCDAGSFILKVTNVTTNSLMASVSYSASGFSQACTYTNGVQYYEAGTGVPATNNSFVTFNKWHVNYIDLSPYMGDNINIEITTADCTAGGHYSYSYFDAECGPLEIHVNGQNRNSSCTSNATISAPANLNAYQWNGPSGFSASTGSFATNTAGVYTLTIPQSPPYQALQKTMTLVISPATVNIAASRTTAVCPGEPVTLTGSGLTNYSWNNGGTLTATTVKTNSTTTYTLTGTNADGCQGFAMHTISVTVCTDIANMASGEARLYPNPNNGEFTMMLPNHLTGAQLVIMNQIGQVVFSKPVQSGENRITVKDLPTGVYYYTVMDNTKSLYNGKLSIE